MVLKEKKIASEKFRGSRIDFTKFKRKGDKKLMIAGRFRIGGGKFILAGQYKKDTFSKIKKKINGMLSKKPKKKGQREFPFKLSF